MLHVVRHQDPISIANYCEWSFSLFGGVIGCITGRFNENMFSGTFIMLLYRASIDLYIVSSWC